MIEREKCLNGHRTGQKSIEVIKGKQNKVIMKQLKWIKSIEIPF